MDIKETYQLLRHKEETEIRLIDPHHDSPPRSVFIHSEEEFIKICKMFEGKYNIYAGINERVANGTKRDDVISVKTVVIDVDAVRTAGFEKDACTAEELNRAKPAAEKIAETYSGNLAMSGNGWQIWIPLPEVQIDDTNRLEFEARLQLFQDLIARNYKTKYCAIDKIGDLPRIIKVIGTKSIKGVGTTDRPHRTSYWETAPMHIENNKLRDTIMMLKPNAEKPVERVPVKKTSSNEIIEQLIKTDKKANALFGGDCSGYKSRSEAEMALCCKLVYFDCDDSQIDQFMSASMIGKWSSKDANKTYRSLTIRKARDKIIETRKNRSVKSGLKTAMRVFSKKTQATEFNKQQPIFYDRSGMWWLWDNKNMCWELTDDIDILNVIEDSTGADVISSRNRVEITNSLKQSGRRNIPIDSGKKYIQFKNGLVNIAKLDLELLPPSPKYFVTNPIPWCIGDIEDTPIMDKLFEEWVGKDYVQTLYEIVAYCLLPDYPIERLFCLIGGGSNGKSCFLSLLRKFIGAKNITSTDLNSLTSSKFEAAKLYKKLACQMGETDFTELNKTQLVKKLVSGKDVVGFEFKNKTPFDAINYAKLIIATNSLPTTGDKTDGFYRRWTIIDFPNQFQEEIDILSTIPDIEYENLARKSVRILRELLEKRIFTNDGTISERAKRYEERSDPFEKFFNKYIKESFGDSITKSQFKKQFDQWCSDNRFRRLSDRNITKQMVDRNIEFGRVYVDWYYDDGNLGKKQARAWLGIKWRIKK